MKNLVLCPALLADERSNDHHGCRLYHRMTNFIDSETGNIEHWILKKGKVKKGFHEKMTKKFKSI